MDARTFSGHALRLRTCRRPHADFSRNRHHGPRRIRDHFALPLNAEQLLLRLLDLIKATTSTRELTAERLSAAMQAPAQVFGPGHFGHGGTLTPEWGYGLEVQRAGTADARLDLNFMDTSSDRKASAAAICQVDFNHFASALDAAGFKRETVRGEHGRVIYDRFDRLQLSIKVDTMPENPHALGDATHACVRLVTVQ